MPQLPLCFSYQAPARIWQIKADLLSNCLALELRDQLYDASFSFLCPGQDKVIFEGLAIEGSLLTSLLAVSHKVLLFEQYDELENPEPLTTLAIDADSQQVLWAVKDYRHLFFAEGESIGKSVESSGNEEGGSVVWSAIGLQSGAIRILTAEQFQQLLHRQRSLASEELALCLPAVYEEGETYFQTVSEFVKLYLQLEIIKRCEYLHVFDKLLISFYTSGKNKLVNHLAVFDAAGILLLHQMLDSNLLQPGSETFMVWNKQLFFIENSSCLKGYNLK